MRNLLPFAVILAAYVITSNWSAVAAYLSPALDYDPAVQGEVVLYATSWCGYCRKTRTLLKAHGIDYREFDIERSTEGKRRFDRLGGHGVPVVTVGDRVIHGYDPDALTLALRQQP